MIDNHALVAAAAGADLAGIAFRRVRIVLTLKSGVAVSLLTDDAQVHPCRADS